MRFGVVPLLLIGALLAPAVAQDVEIDVAVSPKRVPLNGQVQVEVTVSGPGAGNAVLESQPRGKNLIPRGGISTSSQIQILNGRRSAQKSFNLTYLPSGEGEASVPAFTVLLDGKSYQTDPVEVTITEATAEPAPGDGGDESASRVQVHVLTEASRKRIFQGESLTLEYRLLFRDRVNHLAYPQALDPVPDFVTRDEQVSRDIRAAEWQGRRWNEVILFRRTLTPTRAGSLRVDPVLFGLDVDAPTTRRRSIFSFPRSLVVERTAPALTVEVRPLPDSGRPVDFSGAVGRFEISATIDRNELAAGDAAALTVTVRGDVPLTSVTPPELPAVADLRVFDPEVKSQGTRRRSWTYPVVPQSAGRIALPPIRFSYFDPGAEEYRTVETEPIELSVAPGQVAALPSGSVGGRAIRPLATDLHFIKPAPGKLDDRRGDLYRQRWYWMLVALPWIVIPAALVASRRRERLDRSGRTRERRAARQARRSLRDARGALDRDEATEALRLASAAMTGYVADRAHRSAQGLTYDTMIDLARRGGASDESGGGIREVVEGLDRLRYTPAGEVADEARPLIARAGDLITRLEKEWR